MFWPGLVSGLGFVFLFGLGWVVFGFWFLCAVLVWMLVLGFVSVLFRCVFFSDLICFDFFFFSCVCFSFAWSAVALSLWYEVTVGGTILSPVHDGVIHTAIT